MNHDEIVKKAWGIYESEMMARKDSDYDVNEEQMKKLIDAYAFFAGIAERDGGEIDPFRVKPSEISGGVTAYFTVFYLRSDDIKKFNSIVGNMVSLSIDSTVDGDVCISFTIPNVFKKRAL